jgi:hypothetical protein
MTLDRVINGAGITPPSRLARGGARAPSGGAIAGDQAPRFRPPNTRTIDATRRGEDGECEGWDLTDGVIAEDPVDDGLRLRGGAPATASNSGSPEHSFARERPRSSHAWYGEAPWPRSKARMATQARSATAASTAEGVALGLPIDCWSAAWWFRGSGWVRPPIYIGVGHPRTGKVWPGSSPRISPHLFQWAAEIRIPGRTAEFVLIFVCAALGVCFPTGSYSSARATMRGWPRWRSSWSQVSRMLGIVRLGLEKRDPMRWSHRQCNSHGMSASAADAEQWAPIGDEWGRACRVPANPAPHVGTNLPKVHGVITGPARRGVARSVVGFSVGCEIQNPAQTHCYIFFLSFLVSIFYLIYMFKPNSDPVLNSKSKLNAQPKKISMKAHIFMITYLLTIIFI